MISFFEAFLRTRVQQVARFVRHAGQSTRKLWTTANPFERNLSDAVDFRISEFSKIVDSLPGGRAGCKGITFLEVGPGQDLGLAQLVSGLGAKVIVVDPYPCPWDEVFHPKFYTQLAMAAEKADLALNLDPLHATIKARDHSGGGVRTVSVRLEDANEIESGLVDVSYSNASLEHVADGERACAQLGRVTKSGGVGFHQIDLRDHRNFNRPLEYLTISDQAFERLAKKASWSCGNRYRHHDFTKFFEQAGFACECEPNKFATDEYVQNVRTRLQPRFGDLGYNSLKILSAKFVLRKQ